jgi:hypothetical protein
MATINQGVMGGFSGTVGTVVGGKWNGKDYMRGRQTGHTDAKSMAQLDQRARFKTVIQFLKPLKAFLNVGFKNHKAGLSAYNAASSYNLNHALAGVYPDYKIDYSKVKVCHGSLPGALNPSVTAGTNGEILFSWENNSNVLHAMANDKVVLVVYNPNIKKNRTLIDGNSRMSGTQAFILPDGFGKENLQCYIAFRNINQTNISDSQYVGSISL